jgi:hypothetical protein
LHELDFRIDRRIASGIAAFCMARGLHSDGAALHGYEVGDFIKFRATASEYPPGGQTDSSLRDTARTFGYDSNA